MTRTRPLVDFGNASYLNLDVANFTHFCSTTSVTDTMGFLQRLYKKFDRRIAMSRNCVKVKIAGDSYELVIQPALID